MSLILPFFLLSALAPASKASQLPNSGVISWKNQDSLLNRILPFRHLAANNETTNSTTDCPGAPFLWIISEADSGHDVGFAVGTAHLPPDIIMTDAAWVSIHNALDDSCAVYGELNMLDPETLEKLAACHAEDDESDSIVVADVPDAELRNGITATINDIAVAQFPDSSEQASSFAAILQDLPLYDLVQFIQFFNTPEYRDVFFTSLLAGDNPPVMDIEILEEGRPAGALEDVQTQCDLLDLYSPTKNEFLENFSDVYGPQLREELSFSLSRLIAEYRCGDLDDVTKVVLDSDTTSDDVNKALLNDRNVQMAAKITEILQSSVQRPLFAVGLAHWMIGNKSLAILLEEEGYLLERVTETYEAHTMEDLTDQTCSGTPSAPYFVVCLFGGVTILATIMIF